jgi:hypothetical protein
MKDTPELRSPPDPISPQTVERPGVNVHRLTGEAERVQFELALCERKHTRRRPPSVLHLEEEVDVRRNVRPDAARGLELA